MSITIDLPPATVQEAREYAASRGTTLEKMVFDYVQGELARKVEADANANEVYDYLMSQSGWLPSDYTFDRDEANER